jgi:hypothetical protein
MTIYTITETLVRVVEINEKNVPNKLDIAKKKGIVVVGKCQERLADNREIELLREYERKEQEK